MAHACHSKVRRVCTGRSWGLSCQPAELRQRGQMRCPTSKYKVGKWWGTTLSHRLLFLTHCARTRTHAHTYTCACTPSSLRSSELGHVFLICLAVSFQVREEHYLPNHKKLEIINDCSILIWVLFFFFPFQTTWTLKGLRIKEILIFSYIPLLKNTLNVIFIGMCSCRSF